MTRIVLSLVDPPAPYVTDTKSGASGASSDKASHNLCSPASSLGGKNSSEKEVARSFVPMVSRVPLRCEFFAII